MFNSAEIKELAARKKLLTAESEINRRLLELELSRLGRSFAKADDVLRMSKSAYPIALALAPLAGWLFARKGNALKGVVAGATMAFGLIRKLRPLWESFRKSRHSPDGEHKDETIKTPSP